MHSLVLSQNRCIVCPSAIVRVTPLCHDLSFIHSCRGGQKLSLENKITCSRNETLSRGDGILSRGDGILSRPTT